MLKPLKASNDILPAKEIFEAVDGRSVIFSSPKKDGNRISVIGGQILTSSFKEPRNSNLHRWLEPLCERTALSEEMYDMEVWSPTQSHHGDLSGIINSYDQDLPEDLLCSIFDGMPLADYDDSCKHFPYCARIFWYMERIKALGIPYIQSLPQRPVLTPEEATEVFAQDVLDGEEGSMLRTGGIWQTGNKLYGGWYKKGRATNNQCIIWKQKIYLTVDGYIIGVQQRRILRADWPRKYDADGHLIRPLEKDAYELTDMVGAFVVRVPKEDGTYVDTEVGFRKGFDHAWRREAWHRYVADPTSLLGQYIEFKHMPYGAKEGGRMRAGGIVRFRGDIPRENISLS